MVPTKIRTPNLLPFKEMERRLDQLTRSGAGRPAGTMPDDYLQENATPSDGTTGRAQVVQATPPRRRGWREVTLQDS